MTDTTDPPASTEAEDVALMRKRLISKLLSELENPEPKAQTLLVAARVLGEMGMLTPPKAPPETGSRVADKPAKFPVPGESRDPLKPATDAPSHPYVAFRD